MALIKCPECGGEVSDKAPTCPTCGIKIAQGEKPKSSNTGGLVIGVVLVLALVGYCASQDHDTSPSSPTTTSSNQISPAASTPAPNVIPSAVSPAPKRPIYHTTASALYKDYLVNQVATQDKLGDSLVQISGWVSGIELDATNNVVVHLYTGLDNDPAEMYMTDDQRQRAKALRVLDRARVQCGVVRLEGGLLMHGEECVFTAVKHTPHDTDEDALTEAGRDATNGEDESF